MRVRIVLMKSSSDNLFIKKKKNVFADADAGRQQTKIFAPPLPRVAVKVYARLCARRLLRFTKGACAETENYVRNNSSSRIVSRIPYKEQLHHVLRAMRILLIIMLLCSCLFYAVIVCLFYFFVSSVSSLIANTKFLIEKQFVLFYFSDS